MSNTVDKEAIEKTYELRDKYGTDDAAQKALGLGKAYFYKLRTGKIARASKTKRAQMGMIDKDFIKVNFWHSVPWTGEAQK